MSDLAISTDRNYRTWFEAMVNEGLFPTLASYLPFAADRYQVESRLPGARDFDYFGSQDMYPLIRWCYLSQSESLDATIAIRVDLHGEIAIAAIGPNDTDRSESVYQLLETDLGVIREVINRQEFEPSLTQGPFGIRDAVLIAGQGAKPLSWFVESRCGDMTIEPKDGESGNAAGVWWEGIIPITISVIVD